MEVGSGRFQCCRTTRGPRRSVRVLKVWRTGGRYAGPATRNNTNRRKVPIVYQSRNKSIRPRGTASVHRGRRPRPCDRGNLACAGQQATQSHRRSSRSLDTNLPQLWLQDGGPEAGTQSPTQGLRPRRQKRTSGSDKPGCRILPMAARCHEANVLERPEAYTTGRSRGAV